MSALKEAVDQTSTASPFGTNIGDLLGQTLRSGMAEARAETPVVERAVETNPTPDEQQRETVEATAQTERENRENQQSPENATEKKDGKDGATTASTGTSKTDGRNGKPQQRWSEIPLGEGRDILTADEGRRKEAFDQLTKERDEATKERDTFKAEAEELRRKATERDEISGKYEKLNDSYAEQQKRLASVDVTRTDEYQAKVTKPFQEEITDPLKEFAGRFKEGTFNVQFAYDALRSADPASLAAVRRSLADPVDRDDFRELEIKAKGLVKLHNQYVADAPKAYKEITERKTQAEKQANEAHRGEVAKALDTARKANAARFSFLDPASKETHPDFKAQIEKADAMMRDFDFNALKPAEQASFIEAAHKGFLAANYIDGYAAHVTKEKQGVEAERDTLKAKVTELEGRLAKRDGTTLTPGRTGGDSRVEVAAEHKGDAASLAGSLLSAARQGK